MRIQGLPYFLLALGALNVAATAGPTKHTNDLEVPAAKRRRSAARNASAAGKSPEAVQRPWDITPDHVDHYYGNQAKNPTRKRSDSKMPYKFVDQHTEAQYKYRNGDERNHNYNDENDFYVSQMYNYNENNNRQRIKMPEPVEFNNYFDPNPANIQSTKVVPKRAGSRRNSTAYGTSPDMNARKIQMPTPPRQQSPANNVPAQPIAVRRNSNRSASPQQQQAAYDSKRASPLPAHMQIAVNGETRVGTPSPRLSPNMRTATRHPNAYTSGETSPQAMQTQQQAQQLADRVARFQRNQTNQRNQVLAPPPIRRAASTKFNEFAIGQRVGPQTNVADSGAIAAMHEFKQDNNRRRGVVGNFTAINNVPMDPKQLGSGPSPTLHAKPMEPEVSAYDFEPIDEVDVEETTSAYSEPIEQKPVKKPQQKPKRKKSKVKPEPEPEKDGSKDTIYIPIVKGPPLLSYDLIPQTITAQMKNENKLGAGTDGVIYRIQLDQCEEADGNGDPKKIEKVNYALKCIFFTPRVQNPTAEDEPKALRLPDPNAPNCHVKVAVFMKDESGKLAYIKLTVDIPIPFTMKDVKEELQRRQPEIKLPPFRVRSDRPYVMTNAGRIPKDWRSFLDTLTKVEWAADRTIAALDDEIGCEMCGTSDRFYFYATIRDLAIRTKFEIDLMEMIPGKYAMRAHKIYRDSLAIYYVMRMAHYGDGRKVMLRVRELLKPYPEQLEFVVKWAIYDLLRGLKELHDIRVAHHDVKWENSLVFKGKFQLADFGMSQQLFPGSPVHFRGTISTLPPEMLREKNPVYLLMSDFWSLGIMVCEAILGGNPFYPSADGTEDRTKRFIKLVKSYPRQAKEFYIDERQMSPLGRDFVYKTAAKIRRRMKTVDEVLAHEWFNDVRHLFEPIEPAHESLNNKPIVTEEDSIWTDLLGDPKLEPEAAREATIEWQNLGKLVMNNNTPKPPH